MRIRKLILGDIRFQFKYGFYFVYAVFTVFYICLLFAFPADYRGKAATLLIYTDPAAMGLFFMGAIILFEKSQRVIDSIAVSPVKVNEYIVSKVVSIGLIGILAGSIIAMTAHSNHLPFVILGTFLGSIIFSLIGLMAASVVNTLNQFMVVTIPGELLCMLPPIIYLFGYRNRFMLLHPGCIIILLLEGKAVDGLPFLLLYLCLWILLIYYIAFRIVNKMFKKVGGVKL